MSYSQHYAVANISMYLHIYVLRPLKYSSLLYSFNMFRAEIIMYSFHNTLQRRHTNDMAPQIIDICCIQNSLFGLTGKAIWNFSSIISQIARFMGPSWGPPGSCRSQMSPMLAPWTLLSGFFVFAIQQWPLVSPHNGSLRLKTSQCHDALMLHCDIFVRCLYCAILRFCNLCRSIYPHSSGLLHLHCVSKC